jgi:hypothetical protein
MTAIIRSWFWRLRAAPITKRLLDKLLLRLSLRRKEETPKPPHDYLTDALVEREGLIIRIQSSERVRLDERYLDISMLRESGDDQTGSAVETLKPKRIDENYREWIAPLLRLPHDTTFEQIKLEVEKLLKNSSGAKLHFPLKNYMQSLTHNADALNAWAHRCSASSQPSIQLLHTLAGEPSKPEDIADPVEGATHLSSDQAYLTDELA